MAAARLLLCALAAPLLLLQARLLREGEDGFAECNVFFKDSPPEGYEGSYAKICQKYNGEPRFATLYSTEHRVPVYSAFKYSEAAAAEGGGWLIEPQLDDPENAIEEMIDEAGAKGSLGDLGLHQSVLEDYASSNYQPVSLNPSFLNTGDFQRATYTLTNTVPVTPDFKESWSNEVETIVKEVLVPQCENREGLYFIVGAVPSDQTMNSKIAVPEFLWLAACCNHTDGWSMGFIQRNMERQLAILTVEDLKSHLPAGIQLFANPCGEGTDNAQLNKILESISEIRSKEAEEAIGPFFRFVRFLARVVFGIVKAILYTVWFVIKQVLNIIVGGICCLWTGVTSYLMDIGAVLVNVPCDVLRVVGNVLLGCVRTVDNVLSLVGMIMRVPLRFLLDLGSYPYGTVCAIPTVGKEIAVGLFGSISMLFDTVFGLTGSSFSVTSFAFNRIVQRFTGLSEGYDE